MNRTHQPHPFVRAGLAALAVSSLAVVAACSDDDGDDDDIDNPVDGVDDQIEDLEDDLDDSLDDSSTTTG